MLTRCHLFLFQLVHKKWLPISPYFFSLSSFLLYYFYLSHYTLFCFFAYSFEVIQPNPRQFYHDFRIHLLKCLYEKEERHIKINVFFIVTHYLHIMQSIYTKKTSLI
jgi:hypothetical protein